MTNPDQFTPTPWETYTYDANDNAGRTHAGDPNAVRFNHHRDTPSNVVVDALGRTIENVERNRKKLPDGSLSPIEEYRTRSSYDIRGNLLDVTDALTRVAFRHAYDITNHLLRIESIDAGLKRTISDAAGNIIEQRNSNDAVILHAYDSLNRPIRLWARDDGASPVTMREHLIYGDASDPKQPATERALNRTANRLGKLYRHYDEAGLLTFENYDFKGNVLEKLRQVIKDEQILSVFGPAAANNWRVTAFSADWQPPAGTTLAARATELLESTEYRTSTTYDALNRVKMLNYPQDVTGARKKLRPEYNRSGALERVNLDGTIYVDRIAYNAKGQRTLIAYGNAVITRYAYDTKTFRLTRLRSEHYTLSSALTYHPTGAVLQDFAYEYDLVGNILALHDRTPESGFPVQPDKLDRAFTYDAIYRLLSATGRECDLPPRSPWDDKPRCTDLTKTRGYSERYQYDPVGNFMQLQHLAHGAGFTRDFTLLPNNSAPESNRLKTLCIGSDDYDYTYDANGNLIQETTSRHFEWDHSDRMRVYRTQTAGSEPTVYAHYLYDGSGQRVKKLVRKQGGQIEITTYVHGLSEHNVRKQGSVTQENYSLHIMDNQQRIALARVGNPFPDDHAPIVTFHLADHLGNNNVVVDRTGLFVNREEYTPYGETSFGSFARKRYRFVGKERDEESGFNYHGARYYAPWLARWVNCDPIRRVRDTNSYLVVSANPVNKVDLNGMADEKPVALGPLPADIKGNEVVIVGSNWKNPGETTPGVIYDPILNFVNAAATLKRDDGRTQFFVQRSGYETVTPAKEEKTFYPNKIENILGHQNVVWFKDSNDLINKLSKLPEQSVSRLTIFSHGYSDRLNLGRRVSGDQTYVDVDLRVGDFERFSKIFATSAEIISHACNTGSGGFEGNIANSFAQQIADATGLVVRAWDGRTSYAHKDLMGQITRRHRRRLQALIGTNAQRISSLDLVSGNAIDIPLRHDRLADKSKLVGLISRN